MPRLPTKATTVMLDEVSKQQADDVIVARRAPSFTQLVRDLLADEWQRLKSRGKIPTNQNESATNE